MKVGLRVKLLIERSFSQSSNQVKKALQVQDFENLGDFTKNMGVSKWTFFILVKIMANSLLFRAQSCNSRKKSGDNRFILKLGNEKLIGFCSILR